MGPQFLIRPDISVQVHGGPPWWFYDMYDAIRMKVPVHEGSSIRQIPLYIRWRHRLVDEAIRASRVHQATASEAQVVFDVGSIQPIVRKIFLWYASERRTVTATFTGNEWILRSLRR